MITERSLSMKLCTHQQYFIICVKITVIIVIIINTSENANVVNCVK